MSDDAPVDLAVAAVHAAPSARPSFRGQHVLGTSGVTLLPHDCSLVVARDVLNEAQLRAYIGAAARVERRGGPSAFGHAKPRREVCYYAEGDAAYVYSGKRHFSAAYPPHVLALVRILRERASAALDAAGAPNVVPTYSRLSSGVDIVYSSEFERGGSIGAHGDDEEPD